MGNRQEAVKFFNQSVNAYNDKSNPNNMRLAYQLSASACLQDPTWSDAWYQLANANSELDLWYTAVAGWRQALTCEQATITDRAKIFANMSWRLHVIGRTQEAKEAAEEAIRLDPSLHNSYINLSCVSQVLDDADKSLEYAKKAYELQPDDVIAEMSYAFALLFARKFEEGYKRFEARFPYKLRDYLQYPYPKWEGEPGKIVYIVADQGLGDTLSYARFVEAACARAKYVHLRIQSELLRLFQHSFSHIKNLNLIPGLGVAAVGFPEADAWSTFVSLPFALGLSTEEVINQPHIQVPAWSVPPALDWKSHDAKLHIGIAWRGSALNDIDRHRNLPLHLMFDLYKVPGIQLYSLQVGDHAREMHDIGGAALIRDMTPYIREVTDTIAVLNQLDLVITCESALGHICALINKECWIPYSFLGRDYRLGLTGEDRMWCPNHRVFRQGPDQRWEPVFEKIVEALRERLS